VQQYLSLQEDQEAKAIAVSMQEAKTLTDFKFASICETNCPKNIAI
jgi:hypothetical protein